MSKTISTRLEDDEIARLNDIAKMEKIDRSALVRKFLLQKIEEYQMRIMAEHYRKGGVSLQEAATAAKVSFYDMLDFVTKENIRPPIETPEEIEEDFVQGEEIFHNLKK